MKLFIMQYYPGSSHIYSNTYNENCGNCPKYFFTLTDTNLYSASAAFD